MSRRIVFKTAPQQVRPDDPILPETAIYQGRSQGWRRPRGLRGSKRRGLKILSQEEIRKRI